MTELGAQGLEPPPSHHERLDPWACRTRSRWRLCGAARCTCAPDVLTHHYLSANTCTIYRSSVSSTAMHFIVNFLCERQSMTRRRGRAALRHSNDVRHQQLPEWAIGVERLCPCRFDPVQATPDRSLLPHALSFFCLDNSRQCTWTRLFSWYLGLSRDAIPRWLQMPWAFGRE